MPRGAIAPAPGANILAVKQRVLSTSLPDIAPLVARVMKTDEPEKLVSLLEKLNA